MEGGEGSQNHQFDMGHLQHQYQDHLGQVQQVMNDNRQNLNIVNSLNDKSQEEVKQSDNGVVYVQANNNGVYQSPSKQELQPSENRSH